MIVFECLILGLLNRSDFVYDLLILSFQLTLDLGYYCLFDLTFWYLGFVQFCDLF